MRFLRTRSAVTGAIVFAAAVTSGCTVDQPAPAPSSPAPNLSASGPASGPASASPSARPTSGSPYYLSIPKRSAKELSRWNGHDQGGTGIIYDDLRAGRQYRLEGACIFGYDDKLTYEVLDARVSRPRDPLVARGSISCDGQTKTRTLKVDQTMAVQLLGGTLAEKTIGYLRVLP